MTLSGEHEETILTAADVLAARWSDTNTALLRHAFPFLTKGQPVSLDRLANVASADVAEVERAVRDAPTGRSAGGNIVELFGVTVVPTVHRLVVEGKVIFSCCALVAHAVPRLTGRPAEVESVDPVTRELVRLTVGPDGVRSVEPRSAVASLVEVDMESALRDITGHVCSHLHHFTSDRSADEFVQRRPGRLVVSIDEIHRAARRLCEGVWG